jgi:hypothetical protein
MSELLDIDQQSDISRVVSKTDLVSFELDDQWEKPTTGRTEKFRGLTKIKLPTMHFDDFSIPEIVEEEESCNRKAVCSVPVNSNIDDHINENVEPIGLGVTEPTMELDLAAVVDSTLDGSLYATEELSHIFSNKIVHDNRRLFCLQYSDDTKDSVYMAHEYGYLLKIRNHDRLLPLQYSTHQQPYVTFKKCSSTQNWTPVSIHSVSETINLKESDLEYGTEQIQLNDSCEYKSVMFIGTCPKDFIHVNWNGNTKKLLFATAPYIYTRYFNSIKVLNTRMVQKIYDFGDNIDLDDYISLAEMILYKRELSLKSFAKLLFKHVFVQLKYKNFKQKKQWNKLVYEFFQKHHIFQKNEQTDMWYTKNEHLNKK